MRHPQQSEAPTPDHEPPQASPAGVPHRDQVSCGPLTATSATLRTAGRLHIGVPERALYLLAPILIAFAIGMHQLPGVIAGGLTGPDSYMRLVRLEDTLHQHEIAYVVPEGNLG